MTPPLTPYRNFGLMDISALSSHLTPLTRLTTTTTYSLEFTGPAIFSVQSLIEINIQLVSVVVGPDIERILLSGTML